MLGVLDGAIGAYQQAIEQLGLANDVVTFTASDFGRSLRRMAPERTMRGLQYHGLRGAVDGGKIFGTYPT